MKPHEFYLDIDFWEDHCNLVWPVNKESAEQWYKDKFPDKDPEDFPQLNDARAISYCGDSRIIFIKDWEMSVENISYLCHECVHIANHILLDKGVKEKKGYDETLAYFVGYLMRNFLEAIKQIEADPSGGERAVGG
jgi:hypothetical protein